MTPDDMSNLSVGRGKVLEEVVTHLGKKRTNNLIFLGPAGVGKTNLAETLAYLLYLKRSEGEKTADEQALLASVTITNSLENGRILQLNLNKILDATQDAARLLNILVEAVMESGKHVIVFIDEFHLLLDPKRKDLLEGIKDKITANGAVGVGHLTLVGATNMDSIVHQQSRADGAFRRRYTVIELQEPGREEMGSIMLRKYADDVVTEEVRQLVYNLKHFLRPNMSNPDATLDILEDLKAWYLTKVKKENGSIVPIDVDILKAYLEENYVETWESYWSPLLGLAKPSVRVIEKRLSYWQWTCFKVKSLVHLIFRWRALPYPTEEESVPVQIPTHFPNDKRGRASYAPEKGSEEMSEAAEEMLKKVEQALSSPMGQLLRNIAGF